MLQELERPLTSDNVDGIAQSYIKRAQSSFWYFRCLIDPTIKHAWWQQVAAQYLQDFYADMVNGKRPKIIIQAPPQHGKSRLVSDFVGWVAGKDPELKTIFTSYSDELGVTANLRLQRMLQTRAYRKSFLRRGSAASVRRSAGCTTRRCSNMLATLVAFATPP
jgi:hypothetical protein